jgi:mannosyltransferase OCH1-like enzyme
MNPQNYNKPYTFFKSEYKCIVPCNIYQTWHTKELPPKMRERVELLKMQNPGFHHYLFDDNDCREFIREHFRPDVLEAYDSLVPGAYKADLWRLCVLFIKGGIYLDIKISCVNGFRLIELTEQNHFVKDRFLKTNPNAIYNALIASERGNPFLLRAIRLIVANVKRKYYGTSPLFPTGPRMLGALAVRHGFQGVNMDMVHYEKGGYIIYKNRFVISTEYPEYNEERANTYNGMNTKRYDKLWDERAIYR